MTTKKHIPKDDLDTPAVMIDLDVLERNISRLAEMAGANNIQLRPHIKTHKTPEIADLQLKAGAVGITCAKIGEAEVMCEKSAAVDVFIAYQIVGTEKIRRLLKLFDHPNLRRLSIGADSVDVAQPISDAARRRGLKIPVILKTDVGFHRTGVPGGRPALDLARKIERMPGLTLSGLYAYEGQVYNAKSPREMRRLALGACHRLIETAELLRNSGIPVDTVSVGATPSARFTSRVPGITELRCGTYVFNDQMQIKLGSAKEQDCALTITATVISVPSAQRAVIDAGTKSVTSERTSEFGVFGLVKGRPDLRFINANEEHGILRMTSSRRRLRVGDRLEIIPNHVCPVMNLHDEVIGIRNGRVEAVWAVAARGKIR
jgi:D-serine deaminase-like pyridoxal phosphate-dependent protein